MELIKVDLYVQLATLAAKAGHNIPISECGRVYQATMPHDAIRS